MSPNRIPLRGVHDDGRQERPSVCEQQLRGYELRERDGIANEPAVEIPLDGVQNGDDRGDAEQREREPHLPFANDRLVCGARQPEDAVLRRLRQRFGWRRRAGRGSILQRGQKLTI